MTLHLFPAAPILPPSSLSSLTGTLPPPPFGFPPPGFPGAPQDQNLAAAAMAAAMFGGLRPPDAASSLAALHPPPQLPQGPGFPPLHPPGLGGLGPGGLPEGMHPPFPGLPFPPPGDHGPLPFDERGMPPMPPDMLGHGTSFCVSVKSCTIGWVFTTSIKSHPSTSAIHHTLV